MQPRKRPGARRRQPDEDASLRAMFLEYREENAKDLEREGVGTW